LSKYTVNPVTIPALSGVHDGTGVKTRSWNVCDPTSVKADAKSPLKFTPISGTVRALCFDLGEQVVPRRIAVAIREGAGPEAFTRVNLFFHPNPGHAGMTDATYPNGTSWPRLYRYMQNLGTPLAAAGNNMVLVMPYMTGASCYNMGMLAKDWNDVIPSVLSAAKAIALPKDTTPVAIKDLVVSSFCFGIRYSDSFRRLAGPSLRPVLRSVWDFDGLFGTESAASVALQSSPGCVALKYDQADAASSATNFHVPLARWSALKTPPKDPDAVHGLIPTSLFFHACKICGIG
jgi:hypothetical protein